MARKLSVTAPNGKTYDIEAPDNATDEEIQAEVMRVHPEAAAIEAPITVDVEGGRFPKPGENGYNDFIQAGYQTDAQGNLIDKPHQQPVPGLLDNPGGYAQAQAQGFAEGFEKPFNNLAQWTQNSLNMLGGAGDAINKFGADYLGTAPSVEAAVKTQEANTAASPYQSGGLGKFGGEVLGTVLASRIPGGALSKGAQAGAMLSSDPNDALGVTRDATIGGVLGKAGSAVLSSAAKIASPVVTPYLQTLINAGVGVTPGQVGRSIGGRFGSAIARTEDRATSAPFLGDTVTAARNDTLDQFARATINRAVEPIGLKLPDNVPTGRGAVRWAGDKLSEGYNAIAPRIRMDGSDPQFIDDLASIQAETSTMLPERANQFKNILGGLERFWKNQGTVLSGDAFKQVDERLGQSIRRYSTSSDADAQHLGTMLESVRDAMYEAASRQNPAVAAELKGLNQGWKALTQVERASGNSKAAVSPAGYSQAVKLSSDTVRRRGYSRGEALNQDLADAGSSVLPSEIADSGSGGRLNQDNIIKMLIGAAQVPPYMMARSATPLLLRQNATSPALAQLLEYGARGAPYAAPPLISQTR